MPAERLQKIIAAAGVASRRKAEELISAGHVKVNGTVVTELGTKADPDIDHIRVDGKLLQGAQLHVENLIVKDDQAVVELHSLATAKNGMRFDNRYCWVVYFRDGLIVRVRAYLDSAMVARLFEENPIA